MILKQRRHENGVGPPDDAAEREYTDRAVGVDERDERKSQSPGEDDSGRPRCSRDTLP